MAKGMGDILYLYRMRPATRAGVEKHVPWEWSCPPQPRYDGKHGQKIFVRTPA